MADLKDTNQKDTKAVCLRSDLPPTQRKSIQEAVSLLFQKLVQAGPEAKKRAARWHEFAQSLRVLLDKNFEPRWHVLVGSQLGFACKKRDKTMGFWRVGDTSVVIWKSPGLEVPGPAAEPTASDSMTSMQLQVLQPAKVEAGSETERTIAALEEELRSCPSDVTLMAQALRKRLTDELGPIWHVVTGSEFVAEVALDHRNFVLAAAGKTRIVCFQHEQFVQPVLDLRKVVTALPFLASALCGLVYITMSSVCRDPQSQSGKWVGSWLCHEDWEQSVGILGALALSGLFLARKSSTWAAVAAGKEKQS